MITKYRRSLFLLLFVAACSPTRGCIESSFKLARESRLPKWFASAGISRQRITVTLDYWLGPFGGTATFKLFDETGRTVMAVNASRRGNEPISLVPHGADGQIPYPMYEVLTANGITEVIEHRQMEPIFYITDDADVKERLGVR